MALWSRTSNAVNVGYGVIPALPDPFYKPIPAGTYPSKEPDTGIHPELLMKPPYSQDFPTKTYGAGVSKEISAFSQTPPEVKAQQARLKDAYNMIKNRVETQKKIVAGRGDWRDTVRSQIDLSRIPMNGPGGIRKPKAQLLFEQMQANRKQLGSEYSPWKDPAFLGLHQNDGLGPIERNRLPRRIDINKNRKRLPESFDTLKGGKRTRTIRGGLDLSGVAGVASGLAQHLGGPIMETIKALAAKTGESVASLLSNPSALIEKLTSFAPKVAVMVAKIFHRHRTTGESVSDIVQDGLSRTGKQRIAQLRAYFAKYPEKAREYLKQHPSLRPYFAMYDTTKQDYENFKSQMKDYDYDYYN